MRKNIMWSLGGLLLGLALGLIFPLPALKSAWFSSPTPAGSPAGQEEEKLKHYAASLNEKLLGQERTIKTLQNRVADLTDQLFASAEEVSPSSSSQDHRPGGDSAPSSTKKPSPGQNGAGPFSGNRFQARREAGFKQMMSQRLNELEKKLGLTPLQKQSIQTLADKYLSEQESLMSAVSEKLQSCRTLEDAQARQTCFSGVQGDMDKLREKYPLTQVSNLNGQISALLSPTQANLLQQDTQEQVQRMAQATAVLLPGRPPFTDMNLTDAQKTSIQNFAQQNLPALVTPSVNDLIPLNPWMTGSPGTLRPLFTSQGFQQLLTPPQQQQLNQSLQQQSQQSHFQVGGGAILIPHPPR